MQAKNLIYSCLEILFKKKMYDKPLAMVTIKKQEIQPVAMELSELPKKSDFEVYSRYRFLYDLKRYEMSPIYNRLKLSDEVFESFLLSGTPGKR